MKALLCSKGKVKLADVPMSILGLDEVLIRVKLAGVCNTDNQILAGYRNLNGILGHEFVGIVESDPQGELTGKRVVGSITIACGNCWHCRRDQTSHCLNRITVGINNRDGVFAEYVTMPRRNVHIVPDSISDMDAVLTEPLAAGMRVAVQVHILPTDRVAILGDGKMGLLTALVLRAMGNYITVVGKHEDKLSIATGMGLKTAKVGETSGPVDVVVDCTGSVTGLDSAIKLVRAGGTIVLKTTIVDKYQIDLSPIVVREITLVGSRCGPFEPALALMERHNVDLSDLVEAVYPLDQGVEALKHARRKGARKVLISIE